MTGTTHPCVVVTAVHAETRAVLDGLREIRRITAPGFRAWEGEALRTRVRVVQSGIGPERARRALAAMTAPHGLVLCVGFAGALSDGAPGDVVLPRRVVWEPAMQSDGYAVPADVRERARAALAAVPNTRLLEDPLLSSESIVASPEAKRAAHARTGAVAVEMETAGLLPIALGRNASVLPLRVVLDSVDVSLEAVPPDLDSSWRARARLVGRPSAWRAVWTLAREIPAATAKLRTACSAVLASI